MQFTPTMGAPTSVMCSTHDKENTVVGFSICTVDNPQAGTYHAPPAVVGAAAQFALVDLNLAANFAIDQQVHGTGEDIFLTARLNEAGVPVTNNPATHPVKVTVSIKRPTEGFGTYVSTHEPGSCRPAPPSLPPLKQNPTSTVGGLFPSIPPPLVAVPGNEPKPARYAKASELFARCGKTELTFVEDPGIEMFDDGTHGDVTPEDGIYSLRFLNTQFEGSYGFRFKAEGKSPTGSEFSRIKTIGEYVRVNVDPVASPINTRDVQVNDTIVTREYYIIPRDRFGGYLGPGHADQVVFNTTAGTWLSPMIDYNNGIYSRVLRFNRATEKPIVTATVQDQPLPLLPGFNGSQGFEFFPYVGGSFYQNSLRLDNGVVVGARVGYRFPNQVALEGEAGVTFSQLNSGLIVNRDVRLVQVLGNVRYDIDQWGTSNWTPYIIVGAGGIFARSNGLNDSAFAVHGGFGSTFKLTNHVGFRADGRIFRLGGLYGSQSTTAFQFNTGLVFRF